MNFDLKRNLKKSNLWNNIVSFWVYSIKSSTPFQILHFLPLLRVFESHMITYRIWMRKSSCACVNWTYGWVTWVVHVNMLPNVDKRWQHGLAQGTVVSWRYNWSSRIICNPIIQCVALHNSVIHMDIA